MHRFNWSTRVLFAFGCFVGLASSPASAQERVSDAATRDPHIMKLASDGEVGFLSIDERIGGKVPRGSTVLVDIQGMDALTRAAVLQHLLSSGVARVVERDALGTERVISGTESDPVEAQAPGRERVFDLPVENVQVLAPQDYLSWQPPQTLVQLSIYKNPHKPTATLFVPDGEELPSNPVCLEARSVDASTGIISWLGLGCGGSSGAEVMEMGKDLLRRAARETTSLGAGKRVLELPVQVISDSGTQNLPADNELYFAFANTLAQQGCYLMDVPPGASTGGRDGERWSYHAVPFEPVSASRMEGWVQAHYSIRILARETPVEALELLVGLEGMDEQLIDPDLALMDPEAKVPVLVMDIEAVDLQSGRILSNLELSTGRDVSRDMLAEVTTGLLCGGSARSWVELRPIPQSASVRIDRQEQRIVDGYGLASLRPGNHSAELILDGEGQPDAKAKFRVGEYQYGVLPLAAPFGSLAITTTPEGAEVFVDGEPWGPSPVSRTIGGGEHEIVARVDGCGEKSRTVDVIIGEENKALVHLPGFLEASVSPSEAAITVNGKRVGVGQASVQVPYGSNELTYSLEGYRDQRGTLMIDSCQTSEASYAFDGTIVVQSAPKGAQARIDGEVIGNTTARKIVPIGTHTVSCHWCEYGSASKQVDVGSGEKVPVTLDLDGGGFRFALGPYTGLFMHPDLGSSTLRLGAMAETWFSGRLGLQFAGDIGTGDAYKHSSAGLALRTLFPAPGLAMPIALRADMLHHNDGGTTVYPTLATDLRICSGRTASIRVGASGGYSPRGGFLGGLSFGVLWRGNSPWLGEE